MIASLLSIELTGEIAKILPVDTVQVATASMGMPQLDFSTFPSQVFWLLTSLGILYFLLSQIVLPRIETVIGDRQDTISNDLDKAAAFKRRAEEAELAYEEALAEAYAKAEKIAQKTRDETKKDLADAMEKADQEIEKKAIESSEHLAKIEASAKENVDRIAHNLVDAIVNTVLQDIDLDKTVIIQNAQANVAQNTVE